MKADKKSIVRFFAVYFGSLALLFCVIGGLYYQNELQRQSGVKHDEMSKYAKELQAKLGELHFARPPQIIVDSGGYGVGLYDADKVAVAVKDAPASLPQKIGFFEEGGRLYYVLKTDRYFLGVAYLLVKSEPINASGVLRNIFLVGFFALLFMAAVAFYLAKLMIRPLTDSIEAINAFIKDSTHELGTPIMTVSAALESIKQNHKTEELQSVKRLEIGVKTLKIIYDELVMSCFYEFSKQEAQKIEMKELARERIEYFAPLFEYKNIQVHLLLEDAGLRIEAAKASRVVDNILSNAVKYTKNGGNVWISLKDGEFCVKDDGYGIDAGSLASIFDRYARASTKAGGFGIGLATVKKICDEYGIKIEVKSQKNSGSEFIFRW